MSNLVFPPGRNGCVTVRRGDTVLFGGNTTPPTFAFIGPFVVVGGSGGTDYSTNSTGFADRSEATDVILFDVPRSHAKIDMTAPGTEIEISEASPQRNGSYRLVGRAVVAEPIPQVLPVKFRCYVRKIES